MISKELLSEVFGWKIKFVNPRINDNEISFIDYNGNTDSFNVYYVAHKCKEWALEQGFETRVTFDKNYKGIWIKKRFGFAEESFMANTEPEAIFKACQWVLDNKE